MQLTSTTDRGAFGNQVVGDAGPDGALNLGGLKRTDGVFNYDVPPGADVSQYKSASRRPGTSNQAGSRRQVRTTDPTVRNQSAYGRCLGRYLGARASLR
jgi:hypothetical protein